MQGKNAAAVSQKVSLASKKLVKKTKKRDRAAGPKRELVATSDADYEASDESDGCGEISSIENRDNEGIFLSSQSCLNDDKDAQ